MLSNEQPCHTGGAPECNSGAGGLAGLTAALASYLEEINECCQVCFRHEKTTAVHVTRRALHFTKHFSWTPDVAAYSRQAVEGLSGWERSLLWNTGETVCIALETEMRKKENERTAGCSSVTRGIAWQGSPILVCVSSCEEE